MRVAVAVFLIAIVAVAFAAEAEAKPMAKPFFEWLKNAWNAIAPHVPTIINTGRSIWCAFRRGGCATPAPTEEPQQ